MVEAEKSSEDIRGTHGKWFVDERTKNFTLRIEASPSKGGPLLYSIMSIGGDSAKKVCLSEKEQFTLEQKDRSDVSAWRGGGGKLPLKRNSSSRRGVSASNKLHKAKPGSVA